MNIKSNHPEHSQEQNSSISFPINQDRNEIKDNQTPAVEWARIAPNKVIVANAERAWLLEDTAQTNSSSPADQFLTQTMDGAGSIATTRQLLDGAIAAAKYAVNSDVRPPALTATRWVWRLAGLYHLTHPIPELMEQASQKFEQAGRSILADWAAEKAIEEKGHDLLALKDIESLGYDANAVVNVLFPPAAMLLNDYSSRGAKDTDPIDCVGCAYVMERLSLGVDKKYIQKIETMLPKNTYATRCLRVHSSLGADAEHIRETTEMIAKLTPSERIRITRACYEVAQLCFSPICDKDKYISDKELQQILNPLKSAINL